jgi:hypothetical protein
MVAEVRLFLLRAERVFPYLDMTVEVENLSKNYHNKDVEMEEEKEEMVAAASSTCQSRMLATRAG